MEITYHVLVQKNGEVWATTDGPPRDVANWLIKEARRLKKETAMLPPPIASRRGSAVRVGGGPWVAA